MKIAYKFVEYIPEILEDKIVYISIVYCTVVHKCMCGCGNEVVTPISPADWSLTFHGDSISLNPSIGNWSFKCKSHYWITENRVLWARKWSKEKIKHGRKIDFEEKTKFFNKKSKNKSKIWPKLKKFIL
jgi:hypothetical protein